MSNLPIGNYGPSEVTNMASCRILLLLLAILGVGIPQKSLIAQSRRIVTYIEDVQEERRSTRWTLTEWLRIKERMKLMDVWLAMFSKPEKRFAPELSLGYARSVGESEYRLISLDGPQTKAQEQRRTGEEMRAQFWFTNLISGTTGLRTLNVDLGIEGIIKNRFSKEIDGIIDPTGALWHADTERLQTAGVNLRLFGTSSQDSSLVIKGGKFEKSSGFKAFDKTSGSYFGAEMSLYLMSFLGVEGQYYQFLDSSKDQVGERFQVMAFLELYSLRVSYGQERSSWQDETPALRLESKAVERFLSLRLYF
jgi:hypothetical protein